MDQYVRRCLDRHLPRWQHTALRPGDVRNQLLRKLHVTPSVGRRCESQQIRSVQQADGEHLSISAPGADCRGRRVWTEPPEPPQVAWVQLERRSVVLPLPQHAHNVAQPIDVRRAHHNHHAPITTTCMKCARGFRTCGCQNHRVGVSRLLVAMGR